MAFYADFAEYYEQIFPFREQTLTFLEQWLPAEGRLLDIGCGTGGYCGRLAASHQGCLGVDLDPQMIREAEQTYPHAEFSLLDMASVGCLAPERFAGVYCIGNVLSHLGSGGLEDFLSAIKGLLQPEGIWIFQTVNFDALAGADSYVFPVREFPQDNLQFQRRYEADGQGNYNFQTRLIRGQEEIFAGEVSLRPRTRDRFLAEHRAAGFDLMGHFGDFQGTPFAPADSGASIFVFRRNA